MGTQRAVKVKHTQNVQVEAAAPHILPKANSSIPTLNVVARHKVKARHTQPNVQPRPKTTADSVANVAIAAPAPETSEADSLIAAEALAASMPLTLPATIDAALPVASTPATDAAPPPGAPTLQLTDFSSLPHTQPTRLASTNDDLAAALQSPESATRLVREDARLDRRIIDGMLNDRDHFLDAMTQEGFSSNAILRRAAELGLSEALVRQVKGVAADLAGERPGRRSAPAALGARTCLSCDRVFLSSGPGNRLCMRCRGGDAGLAQL